MGAFLTSFRQAFRRTDTTRTGAEPLAAVDPPHTATRPEPQHAAHVTTDVDEHTAAIPQTETLARPDATDLADQDVDDDADGYPA